MFEAEGRLSSPSISIEVAQHLLKDLKKTHSSEPIPVTFGFSSINAN